MNPIAAASRCVLLPITINDCVTSIFMLKLFMCLYRILGMGTYEVKGHYVKGYKRRAKIKKKKI